MAPVRAAAVHASKTHPFHTHPFHTHPQYKNCMFLFGKPETLEEFSGQVEKLRPDS